MGAGLLQMSDRTITRRRMMFGRLCTCTVEDLDREAYTAIVQTFTRYVVQDFFASHAFEQTEQKSNEIAIKEITNFDSTNTGDAKLFSM